MRHFNDSDRNIEMQFIVVDSERFLHRSDGIDDLGGVQWRVAVSLLGVWTIVCLCMIKGIRSYGKVMPHKFTTDHTTECIC